jgi:hypothetical protein
MSKTLKARFTIEERDLLVDGRMWMDPGFQERIRKKRVRNGYISVDLNEKELTELIGSVAAEANHASKRDLAAILHEICDQLESLEDELRNPDHHFFGAFRI